MRRRSTTSMGGPIETEPKASSHPHSRATVALELRNSAAKRSTEFLAQATARLDECQGHVASWNGFLQENQYRTEWAKLRNEGFTKSLAELEARQNARRVSYLGWKLATFAAVRNLHQRFGEFTHAHAQAGGFSKTLGNEDAWNSSDRHWLVGTSPLYRASSLANNVCPNPTQDADHEALAAAYEASAVKNQDLYRWSGAWEPFSKGSHKPFTFITLFGSHSPLMGNGLLQAYSNVLEDPGWTIESAHQDLNERNHEQMLAQIEAASMPKAEKDARRIAQELRQGQKRVAYLSLLAAHEDYISRLGNFAEQLNQFITVHLETHQDLRRLSAFEQMVAKYNYLAAVGMEASILRYVGIYLPAIQGKYRELADEIKPLVSEFWTTLDTNVQSQFSAFNEMINECGNGATVKAATEFLRAHLQTSRKG